MFQIRSSSCPGPQAGMPEALMPCLIIQNCRLMASSSLSVYMCAGCHLKPGRTESDFTLGLYPAPPNLTLTGDEHGHDHAGNTDNDDEASKRQFWIIKHGIKASGMPAWGPGHDDERIWNMVAFLQRLPQLSSDQYQILTARGQNSEGHGH